MTSTDALQHLADAESEQLAQWEARVGAMIREKGGTVSAREFQRALNVLFHDVEANEYDSLHRAMWDSLQPVFDYLATDIQTVAPAGSNWTLVDVGCGTGLATEMILRTSLNKQVGNVQMVDTSAQMLSRCQARAESWAVPTKYIHGEIEELPDASAHLVVTSSVLHHIPNLVPFCLQVSRITKPGGFFVHIHDPRRGALDSPQLVERVRRLAKIRNSRIRSILYALGVPRGLRGKLRQLLGIRGRYQYISVVNRRLIEGGLIKKPLTPDEIWSITDLRLGELPYSAADGISTDELAVALPDFDCVSIRTYCFFGIMPSNLPRVPELEERRLLDEGSSEGAYVAGVWRRRE